MEKKRKEIEQLYEDNGMPDYQLFDSADINMIYGHNIEQLKGFDTLTEEQKNIFRKFIVNYYNRCGFDMRAGFVPKSVYFVEKETFCIDRPADRWNEKPYKEISSERYTYQDAKGRKKLLHESVFHEASDDNPAKLASSELFIRYDYKTGKRKEWLHVTSPDNWY